MNDEVRVVTAKECPVWALGAVYVSDEEKEKIISTKNALLWIDIDGDTQYAEDV